MRVKLGSSSTSKTRILSIGPTLRLGTNAPQHDRGSDATAALLVRDPNEASMQRDDGLANGQPQSRALSGGFGRVEGIEETGSRRLADTRSRVFDLDQDDALPHLELVGLPDADVGPDLSQA